jgi:MFS family permease
MMALLYAVQGAWWPLMAVHLEDQGVSGPERAWIFACQAIGTLMVSLGLGGLVDRVWPTQTVLSAIFALGTAALAAVASGAISGAGSLFALFFIYWMITAPCYGLSNALAFRHLDRPGADFGKVRLWGTAGWMAVGWLVSAIMAWSGSVRDGQGAYEAFWVAAAASGIFAVYALTLPHTPPLAQRRTAESSGPGAVRELLARPGMIVYLITAFGVCLTTPFVFQVMPTYLEARGLPRAWTATVMTIGQWPEIAGLALLPGLIRRRGYKGTILIGLIAWFLRFATLACDPPLWVAVAGTLLHGVGIACITIGGQIYVDQCAPPSRRASAQALNMSVTAGLGSLLGSLLAGRTIEGAGGVSSAVFLVPCLIQAVLIPFFGLAYSPRIPTTDPLFAPGPVRRPSDADKSSSTVVGILALESADG